MANMHFTRDREHAVAVVDVGPGSANVAILTVPGNAPANVLTTGHAKIVLDARTSEQAITQIGGQIQEAGTQALSAYTKGGHHAPITAVYVMVHAPWIATRTVHAGEHFDDDEYIHDPMIAALAQKALTESDVHTSKTIEATVMQVQLNGYPTAHPDGKHAHQIDVTSLVSECEPAVKTAICMGVQQVFPAAKFFWRSGIRALMSLARESAVPKKHYLIVDMGVDSTHVISVRGTAFEQRIIPEGIRTILARIAAGKLPDEALSSLRMLERDACSTEECEAVQKALVLAEPEFLRIFAEQIGQMASTRRAANDLLLVTHPDLEPWLARLFSRIDFSQFTVTTLPFTVSTPSSIGMSRWVTGGIADDSLAVACALVNIESRE